MYGEYTLNAIDSKALDSDKLHDLLRCKQMIGQQHHVMRQNHHWGDKHSKREREREKFHAHSTLAVVLHSL